MINPYVFREYDIRGKVADDFPHHVVVKLGKAFGTFVRRAGWQEIGLSGDIRLTTPELMQSFKEGVLSTGTDVINLGIVPTPVNYFSMFFVLFLRRSWTMSRSCIHSSKVMYILEHFLFYEKLGYNNNYY